MPVRELEGVNRYGVRGLRRLRRLVLAAALAMATALFAAGAASADFWPHGTDNVTTAQVQPNR